MIRKRKYFFDDWARLQDEFLRKKILFFLDFDGTLSPIAPTPEEAVLPQETKRSLEKLSSLNDCKVVIVSGRTLQDIKYKVGLKNIVYIGNHGFEIDGEDLRFSGMFSPRTKSVLDHLGAELKKSLKIFEGVFVEDKGLTISLHYRLVPEEDVLSLRKIVDKIVKPYLINKEVRLGCGKKVWEIKPAIEWDKGKAINWFLRKEKINYPQGACLPIYIGDDVTDEDAFDVVRKIGITILVGSQRSSYAQYYLKDPEDAYCLLERIIQTKENHS